MSGPARLSRRALVGAAAAAAVARAAPAAPLTYDLRPVQVGDGLFMVEGRREYFTRENGGDIANVALILTDTGVVVFDTGSTRRFGAALRQAAEGLSPLGVAAVIQSHHHPDHWFGNQAFADRPIRSLAPVRAAAIARGDDYADGLYRALGDWMRGTEPLPPEGDLPYGSFEIGGRALTPLPLSGHTGADLALLDARTGVLLAGDLLFLDRPPSTPDADFPAWRASIDLLREVGAAAIMPGHGPFDRQGRSLDQTRDYIDWLDARLRAAAEQGLSLPETMLQPLPDRFAALPIQPDEYRRSVAQQYPAFERAALPRVR